MSDHIADGRKNVSREPLREPNKLKFSMALIEAGFTADAVSSFVRAVNSHQMLIDALIQYGAHDEGCSYRNGSCGCGLRQAISIAHADGERP